MKLRDVNIIELLPFKYSGILSNEHESVSRGKVNYWLCKAINIILQEIARGAVSACGRVSLEALEACTEQQLKTLFDELGLIPFWSDVAHSVKAKFIYNVYRNMWRLTSSQGLQDVIAYCLNDYDINVVVNNVYSGGELVPHEYTLQVNVNAQTLQDSPYFLKRLLEYVNNCVPVTEALKGVDIVEDSTEVQLNAAIVNNGGDVGFKYIDAGVMTRPHTVTIKLYGFSAQYQTANANVNAGASLPLYREGATSQAIGTVGAVYRITKAYYNTGVEIAIDGQTITVGSTGALSLYNGDNSRFTFNYIEAVQAV